jgi:hypothetical protein
MSIPIQKRQRKATIRPGTIGDLVKQRKKKTHYADDLGATTPRAHEVIKFVQIKAGKYQN